jgi:hypothetical protein
MRPDERQYPIAGYKGETRYSVGVSIPKLINRVLSYDVVGAGVTTQVG